MIDLCTTKRRGGVVLVLVALALTLQGCGGLRKLAGVDKNPPDEFKVVNKPPLMMPPDYTLRPPKPGEPTPQNLTPTAQAINALFPGRTTLPPPPSPGERALLEEAGTQYASANVRSGAGDNTTEVVEKGTLMPEILAMEERNNAPDGSSLERISSEPLEPDGS